MNWLRHSEDGSAKRRKDTTDFKDVKGCCEPKKINSFFSSPHVQGGQNAKFLIAQKIQIREESSLPLRLLQYFNRKALESSLAGQGTCSSRKAKGPSTPTTSDISPHLLHHLVPPIFFKQKLQKQKYSPFSAHLQVLLENWNKMAEDLDRALGIPLSV